MNTWIAGFGVIGPAAAAGTILVLARYAPTSARSRKVRTGVYSVFAVGALVRAIQEAGKDLPMAAFYLAMAAFFLLLAYVAYKGPPSE